MMVESKKVCMKYESRNAKCEIWNMKYETRQMCQENNTIVTISANEIKRFAKNMKHDDL